MKVKLDEKYGHLQLEIIEAEYKYALFANSDLFCKAMSVVAHEATDLPYSFFSSRGEYSAIIPSQCVVDSVAGKEVGEWSCFRICGDMPFGTVQGLIATISGTLRARSLGVCVVSTYGTDLFFVRTKNLAETKTLLEDEGWSFVSA